ncbi:MAG: helix-turn-helix domain-containing protein, partial [Bacteroidetes bacterium]|nr:helix-turn-helix domain-containing protein [Bacteroidota bacterium]
MKSLYSPKQVAEHLGVSYHKVLELILMGELAAFKVGNAYRIAEADL